MEQVVTKKTNRSSVKAKNEPFTPAMKKAVEDYIFMLKNSLALKDWTIFVDWIGEMDNISYATNTPMEDTRYSTIQVNEKFLSLTPELQTQTLIHEVLHCHLHALSFLAENTVNYLGSKQASNVFDIAFSQALELTIDSLADAVSLLVPKFILPENDIRVKIAAKKAVKTN